MPASETPLQLRYWSHYDRHAAAACVACFRYNGLRPRTLRAFPPAWIRRAVELGLLRWPRSIAWELSGRDVLDVGCGSGLESIGFRLVGARRYVGVDPRVSLEEDRVKNQYTLEYERFGAKPADVARRLGGVELVRGCVGELPDGERFDVAVLHNVTEHLEDIEGTFEAVHRRLRPRGVLRFNHHNFYCWNGHHEEPKTVARVDPADELQKRFVDWNHLARDEWKEKRYRGRLNRVRLDALRELTDRLFEIREWREVPIDERRGAGRLTSEIRARHAAYTVRELTTQAVLCRARKRAVPLPKLTPLSIAPAVAEIRTPDPPVRSQLEDLEMPRGSSEDSLPAVPSCSQGARGHPAGSSPRLRRAEGWLSPPSPGGPPMRADILRRMDRTPLPDPPPANASRDWSRFVPA